MWVCSTRTPKQTLVSTDSRLSPQVARNALRHCGMTCMMPLAPTGDLAVGLRSGFSEAMTATTRSGSMPKRAAWRSMAATTELMRTSPGTNVRRACATSRLRLNSGVGAPGAIMTASASEAPSARRSRTYPPTFCIASSAHEAVTTAPRNPMASRRTMPVLEDRRVG